MNIEEFKQLADELQVAPTPGKRIFVWNGTKEELYKHLPKKIIKELSLSQLSISEKNLTSDANIQKEIKKVLKKELEKYLSKLNGQQILIVSDAELIARYNLGLGPFYDCYVGDKTMVVLLVPSVENTQNIISRDYVDIDETATLRYFQNILEDKDCIRR